MTILSTTVDGVFRKNVLTIKLGADGTSIVIADEGDRGGGNVLSGQGVKVVWINSTGYTCELRFRQLLPDDQPGYGGPVWPFSPEPEPPDCAVVIPCAAGGNSTWSGHLKRNNDVKFVKYDVVLMPAADKTPPPPPLDPIIIIER